MPCRVDERDEIFHKLEIPQATKRHGLDIEDFEAALCGIFTVLEASASGQSLDYLLGYVDWKEAGVQRRVVETWWRKHKAEDDARRRREAREKSKEELKATALSKLTPEERSVLGI